MTNNVVPLQPPAPHWELEEDPRAEALSAAQQWDAEERAGSIYEPKERTLEDEFRDGLAGFALSEIARALEPHPHLFEGDGLGIFPIDEASLVGGVPRAGKTNALVHVAKCGAVGRSFGGLEPRGPFTTVFLTKEDSRRQYVAKIEAEKADCTEEQRALVRERVRVLDFDRADIRKHGQLVAMVHGQPTMNQIVVDALVRALRRPGDGPYQADAPLRLVVIETVSTHSDAGEDNTGFRVFAEVGKYIARELGVAVVLMHHTSQAAEANLRTLDITTGDIRGGTALVANTRQSWMLVGLGSQKLRLKDDDARWMLRKMVLANNGPERVSGLICLDSSKCQDPRPVFLRWDGTRQVEVELPPHLRAMHWWELHQQIGQAKADEREAAAEEKRDIEVRRVVSIATQLHENGGQPTVRAVSQQAGRSDTWAAPYLTRAVELRLLRGVNEAVPRTKGPTRVYRPFEDNNV